MVNIAILLTVNDSDGGGVLKENVQILSRFQKREIAVYSIQNTRILYEIYDKK